MNPDDPLIQVEGLTTHLYTDAGIVRAVEDVSLTITAGEAVALVGESGCGKSMTAMSLMRLVRTPGKILRGSVRFNGQDLMTLSEPQMRKIRGGAIAMVFQDPMTYLNPLLRVGDQIVEAIRIHQGISGNAAREQALESLKKVRLPVPENVINYYPHQLSGCMRQRVLIAVAISCRPAMLIADEPTTALDVTIQAQIMKLLSGIRKELNSAMLLITHDLGLVAEYCDRAYVMYAGRIVEECGIFALFESPMHPYSQALLKSSLSVDHRVEAFETIEGQPPSLIYLPSGCRFHPRCGQAVDRCASEEPPVFDLGNGRWARCWRHEGNG